MFGIHNEAQFVVATRARAQDTTNFNISRVCKCGNATAPSNPLLPTTMWNTLLAQCKKDLAEFVTTVRHDTSEALQSISAMQNSDGDDDEDEVTLT